MEKNKLKNEKKHENKLKLGKIYAVNFSFEPLFRNGDRFRIIKLNVNENLMPIEAVNRFGQVLGFNENELEEINGK